MTKNELIDKIDLHIKDGGDRISGEILNEILKDVLDTAGGNLRTVINGRDSMNGEIYETIELPTDSYLSEQDFTDLILNIYTENDVFDDFKSGDVYVIFEGRVYLKMTKIGLVNNGLEEGLVFEVTYSYDYGKFESRIETCYEGLVVIALSEDNESILFYNKFKQEQPQ